jgi:outer membrane lipoprotein-sorting protein
MRFATWLACSFLPLLAWADPATSGPVETDAKRILEQMDEVTSGYADQEMQVDMVIAAGDGDEKSYGMLVWQKDRKRLVRFTSGENKGLATLIDGDRVYVYMPGFKKVRRVAQHNMAQSFAGSDFSNEDMTRLRFADDFDVVLLRDEADAWVLRGTPKPGRNVSYASIVVTIVKDGYFQRAVDYYDAGGQKVKEFRGQDLTTWPSGVRRYKNVLTRDPRTGHSTLMRLKTFVVNQGLEDDHFSKRQLQWGR